MLFLIGKNYLTFKNNNHHAMFLSSKVIFKYTTFTRYIFKNHPF